MRACKIDNQQINCPNATLLGFGTRNLKAGMFFTYQGSEGTPRGFARSLGRVTAPADGDAAPVEGFILAMVLSENHEHAYIRWVDPCDVSEVMAPGEDMQAFATFFFAPQLPYDADTMVRLMEHGTMSRRYIENVDKRIAEFNPAT